MSDYIVTNIRLREEDYLRLKQEAAKTRKSLSAIIREKVGKKQVPEEYAKKLLAIKSDWFSEEEVEENREEIEKRLQRHSS